MEKRIKTGGRQKGTPNRTQAEIKEYFQMLVSENLELLQSDLESLKPELRVKYIIELSKFIIPQLRPIEIATISAEQPLFPDTTKIIVSYV